jgi:RNA-directed DNA polymerase
MSIIDRMLKELPFSADELYDLISTAQYRYKVYRIPKRQPNQFRTIAQPSPEIKLIQRWLISKAFSSLPIHKAATAYREGKSIGDHAALHAKNRFLLKMDFTNFFPSISVLDVRRYLIEIGKMSVEDARIISLLVCWRDKTKGKLCLSIGAPSSPHLSNIMLYTFDKKIVQLCRAHKIAYSRYADDLAFSTNKKEVLSEIARQVQAVCEQLEYPKLEVNHKKTVSTSRAFRRVLVGLVLTPEGAVSLGREKKRRLRSELYRFSKGQFDVADIPRLRGELAFAWSIEKQFIYSLLRQLGTEVFRKLELPFGK